MKLRILPMFRQGYAHLLTLSVLSFFSIHGFAYDFESGDFIYNIISDVEHTVGVGGYSGDPALVSIPEKVTHEGIVYTVRAIGEEAFKGASCFELLIPNTIERIEDKAFFACYDLKSITIPESVTWIGEEAFRYSSDLAKVILPKNIKGMGTCVFGNCMALEHVVIPEGWTTTGKDTFQDSQNLKSVLFPSSLVEIGEGSFRNCSKLKQLTIPASVTKIGDGAFGSVGSEDVYCFSKEPAQANEAFQFGGPARVHVPKSCKEAYKKAAGWYLLNIMDDLVTEAVETKAGSTSVDFSWRLEEGVSEYVLTLYSDYELLQEVKKMTFDEVGSPTRADGAKVINTLTDLEENAIYYYTILGKDTKGETTTSYGGSFMTGNTAGVQSKKLPVGLTVFYDPAVALLNVEGVTSGTEVTLYSLEGRKLRSIIANDELLQLDVNGLPGGVYLISASRVSTKIAIR